ncbi:MAG: hypothetical protein OK439_02500 [Thaumarchaeota archaeon]|nr:hypothetical protein [Nitrososphaerota archaeon]
MPRDLFIRSFDDELYGELKDFSETEGVTLASVAEEAVRTWIDLKKKTRSRHVLILYENAESLEIFFKNLNTTLKGDWSKLMWGPVSLPPLEIAKRHGWRDVSPKPHELFARKPEQYLSELVKILHKKIEGSRLCGVGNLMNFSKVFSATEKFDYFDRAILVENFHKLVSDIPGIIYCPYDTKIFFNGGIRNRISIMKKHDLSFLMMEKTLYRIRIDEENILKVLG